MALDSYSALQTAVNAFSGGRSDLGTYFADLVRLAEDQISADLDGCPALLRVQTTNLSLASGETTLTLSGPAVSLKALKLLTPYEADIRIRPAASVVRTLSFTGIPTDAALIGNTTTGEATIEVYPTPDQTCTFKALYSAGVVPLDASTNPVNYVLSAAPSIYLYGVLVQFATLFADSRLATFSAVYARAVDKFMTAARAGDMTLSTDMPLDSSTFNISTGL